MTRRLGRWRSGAGQSNAVPTLVEQWNHLDENRERRERYHEAAFFAWREVFAGDLLDIIYDNPNEIWQLVEDWDVFIELETLTAKQKEVLFLTAVRICTPQQIACYKDQTDRAVRKLLAAVLARIRDNLAESIREQIGVGMPDMTYTKRQFLEWYKQEKIALDNAKRE